MPTPQIPQDKEYGQSKTEGHNAPIVSGPKLERKSMQQEGVVLTKEQYEKEGTQTYDAGFEMGIASASQFLLDKSVACFVADDMKGAELYKSIQKEMISKIKK